ncbi:sugar-binding domain-containing protein [Filimonas effusa]|uniref:beta-galactosidase n=1 Tax=Filimonas effusa TaxID=2508721 RepID=A0A4Q1DB41_9BACT|nr:sugar-binding domain-containing protein [Filimonas effusa]RXK86637.1 beta-glucuronidase [Filimonas effusa]
MSKSNFKWCITVALLFLHLAAICQELSLAGRWNFEMDRDDVGIKQQWYLKQLRDSITLPGSMSQAGLGDDVGLHTKWTGTIYDSSFYFRTSMAPWRVPGNIKIPFWLTPVKHYVGAAWYQCKFTIPKDWAGKNISLQLERSHIQTTVWVDATMVGSCNSLVAPHLFTLPDNLNAGAHTLTIRVDNSIKDRNVGPDSHSVSDHTQGNWNGIVGKILLQSRPVVHMNEVQVFPDISSKKAKVVITIVNNESTPAEGRVLLNAKSVNSAKTHVPAPVAVSFAVRPGDTAAVVTELLLGEDMLLWDEFSPALYQLSLALQYKGATDYRETSFGMRQLTAGARAIEINGKKLHLRGDLNNCEFPLTGYPPMDVAGWRKVYAVAKEWGLNHFRFHSWCPPEAAFEAADEAGFYLQVEGPTWPNHGTSLGDNRFIDQYLYEETGRIMKAYGNHPSFCLFAAGNEPAGRNQVKYLQQFVEYWKAKDSRHLYTGASVAMSWPLYPGGDFMIKSGPRGLNWNKTRPETLTDYHEKIDTFKIPYITHEMGQWCAFPDFSEIPSYIGVTRARNLELFKADLERHGMGPWARDFLMASGKLQALCYKNEIEKSLRTRNSAGFQLLGLQDFPGQGTALVGVLNAMWKEKGYIHAKEWRRFCDTTVLLSRMPKFTYTNDEVFNVNLEICHHGAAPLKNIVISWRIVDENKKVFGAGTVTQNEIADTGNTALGGGYISLNLVQKASRLRLEAFIENTAIANEWDFWVYPKSVEEPSAKIYYTDTLDAKAEAVLKKGGTVFMNAAGRVVKGKEIVQYFTPVFWNTSWFKMRPPHTLGIWIDTASAAFKDFPTSYHSDLQWWEIVNNAQVMHLEDFPAGFRPLVQPIDTWFMNRKLGLLMEAKVGKGKLMICSADLFSDLANRPAARQLLYSLKRYMASNAFNPREEVHLAACRALFNTPSRETWDSFTNDTPDELKPGGHK